MNLSDNQVKRERHFCVSSKALAVSPRLQKLKKLKLAFRMSEQKKKAFHPSMKFRSTKKKRKARKKSSGGRLTVCECLFVVRDDCFSKDATRAPSPCHPSEAKSKVKVLLNPPLPHPHTYTQTHTHTHMIKSAVPLITHTYTHLLNTQTQVRTENTHVHMLSRAVMASHPVCPGHIKAKSL